MNSLALILSILILSFVVTSITIIPFIDLLYKLKFQRAKQETRDAFGALTPIFNKFHKIKAGVPVGGGFLVITVVSALFFILMPMVNYFGVDITSNYGAIKEEVNILFFTFLSFGMLGLYDDVKKFFKFEQKGLFGLRLKHKLIFEIILSFIIAVMLYYNLGISILNIPFVGTFQLGIFYIPFATFTIVSFANAINITDGLDGLAAGSLMISLFGLWFLSSAILDIPISIFLALLIGSMISFLYFNVYPARIFMGDVGSLAFGATLAVIGLLLGKIIALIVISFIFVIEISSSLIQLLSKKFLKKKLFPAAPIHLSLQKYGWEEPKIVQRAWLLQIMLTIFGVWLAVL
ncbi:MAG: phospho-N-acetylmuramoyl-pentapeptide-transferase [Pseudomonadales bacterium]|nr:phospho-N-acetylmuramoyl-pentapeptide-transferase [Pseudomonadales bacterium]